MAESELLKAATEGKTMDPAVEEQASLMHVTANRMHRDKNDRFKIPNRFLDPLVRAVNTGEISFTLVANLLHAAADHLESQDTT